MHSRPRNDTGRRGFRSSGEIANNPDQLVERVWLDDAAVCLDPVIKRRRHVVHAVAGHVRRPPRPEALERFPRHYFGLPDALSASRSIRPGQASTPRR